MSNIYIVFITMKIDWLPFKIKVEKINDIFLEVLFDLSSYLLAYFF